MAAAGAAEQVREAALRPAGGQLLAVAAAGSRTAPSRTPPFTGCAAARRGPTPCG